MTTSHEGREVVIHFSAATLERIDGYAADSQTSIIEAVRQLVHIELLETRIAALTQRRLEQAMTAARQETHR